MNSRELMHERYSRKEMSRESVFLLPRVPLEKRSLQVRRRRHSLPSLLSRTTTELDHADPRIILIVNCFIDSCVDSSSYKKKKWEFTLELEDLLTVAPALRSVS